MTTRSGTLQPSPVIETWMPLAARADHSPTKTVRIACAASSSPTLARAFALGDRAAHARELALERRSTSPGSTMRLNRQSSMPAKNGDLAAVLLGREHRDRAGLRDRLDRQHARHDRPLGEVPGEPPVVGADLADADDALAGLELEDLVDEQERRAVRDQRLDHVAAERRDGNVMRRPVLELLAQPVAAAVRVALRGADGHAGRLGDLLERVAERVLQQHDLRLLRRDAGERVARARGGAPTCPRRAPGSSSGPS